jgi:cardiolipin synthase
MMKAIRFTVLWLILTGSTLALPADDVIPIPNRDYFPALYDALNNAQEKIHVFMFSARYYPDYPDDANTRMLEELAKASARGIEVVIILDASDWNSNNTRRNQEFAEELRARGVEGVYYDPPDVTSHDKLILIDDYITIIGSTNWSYYALERNNEASVLIKSKEVTGAFESHFQEVLRLSTQEMPVTLD